jgi:hypothetical protein
MYFETIGNKYIRTYTNLLNIEHLFSLWKHSAFCLEAIKMEPLTIKFTFLFVDFLPCKKKTNEKMKTKRRLA